MTTHMKAPSGTGTLAFCRAPGATVTNVPEHVDCEDCNRLVFAARLCSNPAPVVEEDRKNTHYDAGGIETIDVIRAKLTPEQFKGFCLGNAIKYTLRANFKGAFAADADKAADYTMWLSEHTKGR